MVKRLNCIRKLLAVVALVASQGMGFAASTAEPGLLFHVSGDQGTTADFSAAGLPETTFEDRVRVIEDGAIGPGVLCEEGQRLAWRAPGHIFAQRGTVAFCWRSNTEVGPTEFPVFRVGYADHSSWDMVWLRIDYNGHGFDAFVTDASLARLRVSCTVDPFPDPKEWTHLAFVWDETEGVRLYVNGKLAASLGQKALLDAGLDQFGFHSRIISPYAVHSGYNFVRGGDFDELRIYDSALDAEQIARLAAGEQTLPVSDSLEQSEAMDAFRWRYGWNRPSDAPPYLEDASTRIRKVEIHDAYDLKRWWWKANDGIRETTWPGVYNRSQIPGRADYFILPDWDCYSTSGDAIRFQMPEEPWNHLEISGAAWGSVSMEQDGGEPEAFFRPKGQEKTVHRLAEQRIGGQTIFKNVVRETPIGEFAAYHVAPGDAPHGSERLRYRLSGSGESIGDGLGELDDFIAGRFPSFERQTMLAVLDSEYKKVKSSVSHNGQMPLVHLLIPNTWDELDDGLDGIELELPPLKLSVTHGELLPLNLRVKDPLWPGRDMLDFSFSVRPGEGRKLWLDLRDRMLPPSKPLYLTLACSGYEFGPDDLEGARLNLVFKAREQALAEHEIDRLTQVRDAWAMATEEHPYDTRYAMWNRISGDLADLMRVSPEHELGVLYQAVIHPFSPAPPLELVPVPDGVPRWAHLQVELLRRVEKVVHWYIDNRQISNGEFGGGLSDDTDFTNFFPAAGLMGSDPEKLKTSLRGVLEACYEQGLFTNGLATIQTDELHAYEDGINALGENMLFDYGSPKLIERAMETTRGIYRVTGVNDAGHRHFRSNYYGGSRLAEEGVWGWSKPYSYLVLHPTYLLEGYNGNPAAEKIVVELADSLLAHRKIDDQGREDYRTTVHFETDEDSDVRRGLFPWQLYWSAWEMSGDDKFLAPIRHLGSSWAKRFSANSLDLLDEREGWGQVLLAAHVERTEPHHPGSRHVDYSDAHFAWQMTGDKRYLESLYEGQIHAAALREYINTEGSIWIDRVIMPTGELQRARLGGHALVRNGILPGHAVSWKFDAPAKPTSLAILIPDATPDSCTIIVYNLETSPVLAEISPWTLTPGSWSISQGIDSDGDDIADQSISNSTISLERGLGHGLTFAPRATTVLKLKLEKAAKPYSERPDLAIEREDSRIEGNVIVVRIHSIGAVSSKPSKLVLKAENGEVVAKTDIPALSAPLDLVPVHHEVRLTFDPDCVLEGALLEIESDELEITRINNVVTFD